MIPSAYIQEWSATTPWSDPRQVEQALIICRALRDILPRNIGIIGYAGAFPIATFLLTPLFWKTEPVEA